LQRAASGKAEDVWCGQTFSALNCQTHQVFIQHMEIENIPAFLTWPKLDSFSWEHQLTFLGCQSDPVSSYLSSLVSALKQSLLEGWGFYFLPVKKKMPPSSSFSFV